MDFTYPPEAEAFRSEFRAWLDEHLTDRFRGLERFVAEPNPDTLERMREWNHLLADAGYAAIAWPKEYGGRGASVMEQVVWAEEMSRADAPPALNLIGISNIAPSIMEYGTPEQKQRFLPPMRRGDDIWCQGFSEPDAGSDLASLKATAVRDGDHYVVNGQKVWNTLGNLANWCELLVRTDPDAPKHKGISCLLVDMTLPGVEVRPLVTITGEEEFNEIFFTDVRVPADALLGPENEGWRVAMNTLTHERAGVASLHLRLRKRIQQLIDTARETPAGDGRAIDDPALRRRLAEVYLHGEFLKLLADRAISGSIHGRPAGPESSLVKLVWSEVSQELADVAADVLGPDAVSGDWARDRVYVRALSIAGGTTQVNKNIVAERILGLPKGG
ncbi:MAG TPA: acyl-CoA dehydrogenase family protein [Acidimicrobiia bacterium]|nr:acyl-CoA dehydrogenase family protein [Acidimicrobiia bacterium]